MPKEMELWVKAQKTTFENWINLTLKETDFQIADICEDLQDGTVLYALYQQLTDKNIKMIDKKPKNKISKLQNLNCVLEAFVKDRVRMVNIQGEDIYDKNLKLILGCTWNLIQKYHIIKKDQGDAVSSERASRKSNAAPKKILLNFFNSLLKERKISNFLGDLKDGRVLAEVVNEISPGTYPKSEWPEDAMENIKKAMAIAKEKLDIPQVIEAEYILNGVDELSNMTYATYLKNRYEEIMGSKLVASKCVAYGKGLENNANCDSPFDFTIELRNGLGNICPIKLEEKPSKFINLNFTGPQYVQYDIDYIEPGKYLARYDAVHPGKYSLDITMGLEGPSISELPFMFSITKSPHKISGSGIEPDKISPDGKYEIQIDSGTKIGGLLEEKEISVAVSDAKGKDVAVTSKDLENGSFVFSYTLQDGNGPISVKAMLFKETIFEEKIEKKPLKPKIKSVEVFGEMVERGIPDNRATGFVVKPTGESGEFLGDVEVKCEVADEKGEKMGEITVEKSDKEFQINVDGIEKPGKYLVSIFVDNEKVKTFEANSILGTQPEFVEGVFTFLVHAKDKNGDLKKFGGDDWEVIVTGPNDSKIDVKTKDHGDGKYSAEYRLMAVEGGPSTFKVEAKLDGKHVASSPFKHELSPKPSVGQRIKNFFKRKM